MNNRSYHALSGGEVKQLITAEINRQLSLDTEFGNHVTMREVEWEWTLRLKCYPRENPEKEVTIAERIQQCDERTNKPVPAVEGEEPVLLEVTSSRSIDLKTPPDEVRKRAGMHVPQPKMVPGTNEMVDVPMEVTEAEAKAERVRQASLAAIQAKREPVVSAPVDFPVAKAEDLAVDVVDDGNEISLGLGQDGAVPLPNVTGPQPGAHLVSQEGGDE